jgi:hypothetical protein
MKQLRNNVIRADLEAFYLTGAHHLLRPIFCIFTRATLTSSRWTNCTRDFANAISRGALPVSPSTTAIATTGISRFRS